MPEIGEIKLAREIGRRGDYKHIWAACENCEKERWVQFSVKDNQPKDRICKSCSNGNSKGGRIQANNGYIAIWLRQDDFFFPMVTGARSKWGGYIPEHRLVVAKALGRNLHSWEIVHHKKGFARDDNRYPETLQLVSDLGHKQITLLQRRISHLEQRVLQLEIENIELQKVT